MPFLHDFKFMFKSDWVCAALLKSLGSSVNHKKITNEIAI